jgi:hypothetical protein
MKNVFKVLGIIALVAVIGFGLVSCGGDDDDGGGGGNKVKWRDELCPKAYTYGYGGRWIKDGAISGYPYFEFTNSTEYGVTGSIRTGAPSQGGKFYRFDLVSKDDKPEGQESSFTVKVDDLGEKTIKYTLAADKKSFEVTDLGGWTITGSTITGTYKVTE